MGSITVLDGGMGKELRRIGAPFRQPEWSALALMEAPEMVALAHRNFIEAGAHVITTNNYAVVPYHLGDELFEARGRDLIGLAGRVAREVADESAAEVLVAGSLPPLFGSYEPTRFVPEPAAEIYASIVEELDPYIDVWLAETLSLTDEMIVIAGAIAEYGSGQTFWSSFSLPDNWEDDRVAIRSGQTPADVASVVADRGDIGAVLFNCSLPEQIGPAIDELAPALSTHDATVRFGAYANAFPLQRGTGYAANEVIFERRAELTAEYYSDTVAEWVAAGATIVGGCCDMYPEHIAALAERFGQTVRPVR